MKIRERKSDENDPRMIWVKTNEFIAAFDQANAGPRGEKCDVYYPIRLSDGPLANEKAKKEYGIWSYCWKTEDNQYLVFANNQTLLNQVIEYAKESLNYKVEQAINIPFVHKALP